MQDFYRLIRSKVEQYATSAENLNADGTVNWDFVDADCFADVNPTENCNTLYYQLWEKAVDNFISQKSY